MTVRRTSRRLADGREIIYFDDTGRRAGARRRRGHPARSASAPAPARCATTR